MTSRARLSAQGLQRRLVDEQADYERKLAEFQASLTPELVRAENAYRKQQRTRGSHQRNIRCVWAPRQAIATTTSASESLRPEK